MKQNSITKGKLACIGMKSSKSRQTNSSFGYFDLGEKEIVAYNLKHLLRGLDLHTAKGTVVATSSTSKTGTLANKIHSRRKLHLIGNGQSPFPLTQSHHLTNDEVVAFSLELP
jgi:hypothetical protein